MKKKKKLKMEFKRRLELSKSISYDPVFVKGPTKEVLRTEKSVFLVAESATIISITGGVNVDRRLIIEERV